MKKINRKSSLKVFMSIMALCMISSCIFSSRIYATDAQQNMEANQVITIDGSSQTINMVRRNDVSINAETSTGLETNVGYERYQYNDNRDNMYLLDEKNRLLFYEKAQDLGEVNQNSVQVIQDKLSKSEITEKAEDILEAQIQDFSEYTLESCESNLLDSYTLRYRKQIDEGISDFAEIVMDSDGSAYSIFINYANLTSLTDEMKQLANQSIDSFLPNYEQEYESVHTDVAYYKMNESTCASVVFYFEDSTGVWTEMKDYVLYQE